MLVFKDNFKNCSNIFKESLNSCEFLSFDCEMTGISYDLKTDGTKYDNHQFRYFKCKEIAKKFDLIQVGITFYIQDKIENKAIPVVNNNQMEEAKIDSKNKIKMEVDQVNNFQKFKPIYLERTFTFFLFKNSKLRYISENVYSDQSEFSVFSSFTTCHPGSLKFLNENKFDLNNLIANGIHYNKLGYAGKIKDAVKKYTQEGKISNSVIYLSKLNEQKVVDTVKKITKFLIYGKDENIILNSESLLKIKKQQNNNSQNKNFKIENLNGLVVNYLVGTNLKKIIKIQGFNLLKDKSDKTNSTIIVEKSKNHLNSDDFFQEYGSYENFCDKLTINMIFITKYSHFLVDKELKNLDELVEEELGFSKFIELIVERNKTNPIPIVGHNIYFDLLFIFEKFLADLPENFYEYKLSLHKHFPILYDNKFLTTRLAKEFDNTKLEALYKKMKKNKLDVYVDIKQDLLNGFSFYHDLDSNLSFHDAGYDSIITGRCFVYLLKGVENLFEVENKKGSSHQIGKQELKNKEAIEIKQGFIDYNMRNDILKLYANKTALSLLEQPFDLCELDTEKETFETFLKFERDLLNNLYEHVYVVGINPNHSDIYHLYSIYEFAKLFENEYFNLSVIKIDDHVAFVEFLTDHNIEKDKHMDLINQVIKCSFDLHSDLISYVINYKEFSEKHNKYILIL